MYSIVRDVHTVKFYYEIFPLWSKMALQPKKDKNKVETNYIIVYYGEVNIRNMILWTWDAFLHPVNLDVL